MAGAGLWQQAPGRCSHLAEGRPEEIGVDYRRAEQCWHPGYLFVDGLLSVALCISALARTAQARPKSSCEDDCFTVHVLWIRRQPWRIHEENTVGIEREIKVCDTARLFAVTRGHHADWVVRRIEGCASLFLEVDSDHPNAGCDMAGKFQSIRCRHELAERCPHPRS
jgi:hypothetical protein